MRVALEARRTSAIEKALTALAHGATHQSPHAQLELAQSVYASDKLVNAIVERGNAPVGTTSASGFASQIAQNLVAEFLASLAPLSAASAIISQGLSVPMQRANQISLPGRTGAPSTTVSWAGEESPVPVRSYTVNDDTVLSPRKFGFIVGISRELARRAGGEGVVRQLLREDAAATLDGSFFNNTAGDATAHAGMLAGIAPLTGYGGGDRLAAEADLEALSDAVTSGGSGQVAFVVSPKRAARIRIRLPDLNRELMFLPSLAVADTTIIAVDPPSWAHGFGDDFDIDAATDVTLHLSTVPLEIVSDTGPTTADPVRSFFQTASIAIRLLADVAFAPRRPSAAAWLTGATW